MITSVLTDILEMAQCVLVIVVDTMDISVDGICAAGNTASFLPKI